MRTFAESVPMLLQLLLLTELLVHSACRPAPQCHCARFTPMIRQMTNMMEFCKNLHGLTESDLDTIGFVDHNLEHLPQMEYTTSHFNTMKLNESLSQLYLELQAFKLHTDWLEQARENVSLPHPSQKAGVASKRLQLLSNLTSAFLQQIDTNIPELPPTPSLPEVFTAFDVVRYALEISERLQSFSDWSVRVLRHLKSQCSCR